MEWERWTVKSRKKKESVDNGVWYTIDNREQNRHHLQYVLSAIEVMITHYTLNSVKYILDKMEIPSFAYGYKKIIYNALITHSQQLLSCTI
jgi:elongation factor P hydroxylase